MWVCMLILENHLGIWRRIEQRDIVIPMSGPASNIEAVARDICARQLARTCASDEELATDVDRYWHCVAAQLESGQIDDASALTQT